MKHMASFIGVLALLILLPAAAGAELVGMISYVEEEVEITSPDQIVRPAHIGTEVHRGDIICTKGRAKAEITLTDASLIRISQNSRVEISGCIAGNRMRTGVLCLLKVKILNIVSKFFGMASFFSPDPEVPYTAVAGVR